MLRFLILAAWLFFVVTFSLNAQIKSDSTSNFTFEKAISAIEARHGIRFFYDAERLNSKPLNRSIVDLPLDECIRRICNLTGYSVTKINGSSYIFLPEDINPEILQKQQYLDFISVGNPLDFGKFKNADVEGTVKDGKNGDPLAGAMILDEKFNIVVSSDKNGNFTINLPVGDHDLTLKSVGYEDNHVKVKVYGKGKLALELYEKSIKLDEVVVRAEMAQNSVVQNQMSMVRIDAKAIKELPVSMGETDIIRSVTLMPGVQSVGEFGTGFNVRGGSADQNLVLLEDLLIFNPSHVFGLTSIVNPDDISSVTLLKAGIPAQYGERASSVLDIKMDNNQADHFSAKGGLGLINSRLSVKTPIVKNKVTLTLGGRSSYSDWLLGQLPDIDLRNSSASFYDLNGSLNIKLSNATRFSIFGYESKDKFRFGKTTSFQYDNGMAGARLSHIFNNNFSFSLMGGRSIYRMNIDEDIDNQYDQSKIKSSITYDCLRWNFQLHSIARNELDFGLNGLKYSNNPGELLPGNPQSLITSAKVQDEKALELSAYISDKIEVSKKLTMEGGVRFTNYFFLGPFSENVFEQNKPRTAGNILEVKSYKNNEVVYSHKGIEPRLSAIYRLNGESSLKASYSRVHQYLNLISNTSVMAPTDVWKLSNNEIHPLICNQVAIGYYRTIPKRLLELSVELYFKDLQDVIEYKDGAKLLINQNIETDLIPAKGYNYGVELFLKKNYGRLTGWATYSYSRSMRKTTSTFEEEQILGNKYFPSNYDKPHNLTILTNYHISRRWRFSSTFMYSTGRPATYPELQYNFNGNQLIYYSDRNKYRLPDYHRLDVSITLDGNLKLKKRFKSSWTFSVVNLYARKNAFSAYYQKESPNFANDFHTFGYYKLYIIGKPFPTLTYNFTF